MNFGIDVSRWQGNFNFKQAMAEGVTFAILKAGGGDGSLYKDGKFESYYKTAKSLGLPVGAYFFGNAKTVKRAEEEADKFLSILSGHQLEYPVYYDVEGAMLNLNKTLLTDISLAFMNKVESAGYFTGIYSGSYAFNHNFEDKRLTHFCHWVAAWTKSKPKLSSGASIGMWQFGGSTNLIRDNKIAGVVCDQDYCYVDYPSAIKSLGLNGFPKPTQDAQPEQGKNMSKCKVTAKILNCRDAASTKGKIIGAFKRDMILDVAAKLDGWYAVSGECGGKTIVGFCSSAYLKDV